MSEPRITLTPVSDLTDEDRALLGELSAAVYPPEVSEAWPGRDIEWSPRGWSVLVREGRQFVAHAGIVVRRGRSNDAEVGIGGIGGVMTHPEFRGRGLATAAIAHCLEFFRERGNIDFGLLVCEPRLIPFYQHLGWHSFAGQLQVTQRGQSVPFTFNLPMTYPIRRLTDVSGMIDLLGPPW